MSDDPSPADSTAGFTRYPADAVPPLSDASPSIVVSVRFAAIRFQALAALPMALDVLAVTVTSDVRFASGAAGVAMAVGTASGGTAGEACRCKSEEQRNQRNQTSDPETHVRPL